MAKRSANKSQKKFEVSAVRSASASPQYPQRSPFDLVPFPCLRCGKVGVAVAVFPFLVGVSEQTFACRLCDAEHYVGIFRKRHRLSILYDRYTRRYSLEEYGQMPPSSVVTLRARKRPLSEPATDAPFGPILVYPRKRRFSAKEVEAIWSASRCRCHICKKRWALSERSRIGWHVDHVIPHIGGGPETEIIPNFLVACAKCNQQKGRGYSRSSVTNSIRDLQEYFEGFAFAGTRKS